MSNNLNKLSEISINYLSYC